VEWFERGETKGKEVNFTKILYTKEGILNLNKNALLIPDRT